MPKIGMAAIRRQQLVDATLELVHENGLDGLTVSQVSAKAGLATGMVHHYFANKHSLLEATLRDLNKRICREIVARLQIATSPLDRVHAFIDGNTAVTTFTAANVSAWLAFWAQVQASSSFARIHRVVMRRTHSTLVHALSQIVDRPQAVEIAEGLAIYVDGLWLRAAVDAKGPQPEKARRLAHAFLASQIVLLREESLREP